MFEHWFEYETFRMNIESFLIFIDFLFTTGVIHGSQGCCCSFWKPGTVFCDGCNFFGCHCDPEQLYLGKYCKYLTGPATCEADMGDNCYDWWCHGGYAQTAHLNPDHGNLTYIKHSFKIKILILYKL